jgi:hypothetical protein
VLYTCNLSTWKGDVVLGQAGLHSKTLAQKMDKKPTKQQNNNKQKGNKVKIHFKKIKPTSDFH